MGPVPSRRRSLHLSLVERAVADAFRRAHWRVVSPRRVGDILPDLLVQRGDRQYAVEIKSSSEIRRDRLIPILSHAILQAKAAAASQSAAPLAVVGVPRVSESLFDNLRSFAAQVAPDVSIGIIDPEGSRIFAGPDLDELNHVSMSSSRSNSIPSVPVSSLQLFSDLNQWMIKVLLSSRIPSDLLDAPRDRISGISELARVARVSVMSAFRCVSALRVHGFVDEHAAVLRLVNIEQLLSEWRAASHKPIRELPMRWLIPGDPKKQLLDAIKSYVNRPDSMIAPGHQQPGERGLPFPRICLGLFAAAEMLGFGFVHGVAPHLYLERFDRRAVEALGLVAAHAGQRADILVRIASFRESVFRGAVSRDGVPASDVLQVWLDVADHPARGASQANEIWRRVLVPLWKADAS